MPDRERPDASALAAPVGVATASERAARLSAARSAVPRDTVRVVREALVASHGAAWVHHREPRDALLLAFVDWLAAGSSSGDVAERLQHGTHLLHLVADRPHAPWLVVEAIAGLEERAWDAVFAEVFGGRGVEPSVSLLLYPSQPLSPALVAELLALVGMLGGTAQAEACAWTHLACDDRAVRRRCRAMLRARWSPQALLEALRAPQPGLRLGAAELLEGLPADDDRIATSDLDALLAAEREPAVARILRRAVAHRRLFALRDSGAACDEVLASLAPPEGAMFHGRIATAMLRWRDETPLGPAAGRFLLDALADEDGEYEVPVVAFSVRELLESASCHAFAEQLEQVMPGPGGVGRWAAWAWARFGEGAVLARAAGAMQRAGEEERALALLERNPSPDARALLEAWMGDPWGHLAGPGAQAPSGLDALLDRGVSHRGLDAGRRRPFRYGRHALYVELELEGVTRVCRADDGAVLERLPDAAAGDDLLVLRARRRWLREYRAELEASYARAVQRLAEPGRQWRGAAFRRDVLEHPVLLCAAHAWRWCLATPRTPPGEHATVFRLDGGVPRDPRGLRLEIADDARIWRQC